MTSQLTKPPSAGECIQVLRLASLVFVAALSSSNPSQAEEELSVRIDSALIYTESQTAWSHELAEQMWDVTSALLNASDAERAALSNETIDRLAALLNRDFTKYQALTALAHFGQRAERALPTLTEAMHQDCIAIGVSLASGTYPVFRSGPPSFIFVADSVSSRLRSEAVRSAGANDIEICEDRFPGSVWETAGMEPPRRGR